MNLTSEQIIGKLAERFYYEVIGKKTTYSPPNIKAADEMLSAIAAELQPLADLIRAAQRVMSTTMADDDVKFDAEKDLRAALEKLGSI